jgi:hypothetical protein
LQRRSTNSFLLRSARFHASSPDSPPNKNLPTTEQKENARHAYLARSGVTNRCLVSLQIMHASYGTRAELLYSRLTVTNGCLSVPAAGPIQLPYPLGGSRTGLLVRRPAGIPFPSLFLRRSNRIFLGPVRRRHRRLSKSPAATFVLEEAAFASDGHSRLPACFSSDPAEMQRL